MSKPMMTDLDWLRAAVQAEAALDYDIQIGGRMPERRPIDPIKLKEQLDRVRIYSLLFGELKRLLDEVDFGSGAEAAHLKGRQLIIERMQSLTPDQKASLDTLLADSARLPPAQLQPHVQQQLYQLLSESDWQSVTATALATVQSKHLSQVTAV